jgi:hypothetical protein
MGNWWFCKNNIMVGEPRREGEQLGLIKGWSDVKKVHFKPYGLVFASASDLVFYKVLLRTLYGYHRDDLHSKWPTDEFFFLDIQGAEHPKLVLNAKIKPDFVLLMQIRSKCFLGLISLMQCIVSVMMKQSTKALEILEHQIFYAQ